MATNNQINNSFSSSGLVGTTTNNDANSGIVGEFISSIIPAASAISLGNGTPANITSISLTAGDWDVFGNVSFSFTGVATFSFGWVSITSATLPDASLYGSSPLVVVGAGITTPYKRISISSTTTIYLSAQATIGIGAVTACGGVYARRAR